MTLGTRLFDKYHWADLGKISIPLSGVQHFI